MPHYRLPYGDPFRASDAQAILAHLSKKNVFRNDCFKDGIFMSRFQEYQGHRIRNESQEAFIADLLTSGFLQQLDAPQPVDQQALRREAGE